MNRRSFLGIIGVGVACPLSLLKTEPLILTHEQFREYLNRARNNPCKDTKFICKSYKPGRYIVSYKNQTVIVVGIPFKDFYL